MLPLLGVGGWLQRRIGDWSVPLEVLSAEIGQCGDALVADRGRHSPSVTENSIGCDGVKTVMDDSLEHVVGQLWCEALLGQVLANEIRVEYQHDRALRHVSVPTDTISVTRLLLDDLLPPTKRPDEIGPCRDGATAANQCIEVVDHAS